MIQKPFDNKRCWLPALISGMSGLLGSGLGAISTRNSNRTNLKIARETNQTNKELAEQANQWNLEQWNRENEYNSPLAQMERLRAAGLNPNLVYGNGATTTAAKSPSAEVATMQPAHMQPYTNWDLGGQAAVSAYLQSQQVDAAIETQGAQRDMLGAQAQYLHNKSLRERAETLRTLTNNNLDKLTYNQRLELYDDVIQQGKLKTTHMGLVNDKTFVETELGRAKTTETLANVDKISSETGLNRAKSLLVVQEIEESASRIALNYSNAALADSKKAGQDIQNRLDNATFQQRRSMIINTANEIFVRCENLRKEGELTDAKIKNVIQDTCNKRFTRGTSGIWQGAAIFTSAVEEAVTPLLQ